jgi:hypothetical protein
MLIPLFDYLHCFKILVFSGLIGDPGIAHGHLYFLVTKKTLKDLYAHTAIEHIGGKRMTQAVKAVTFIG